MSSLLSLNKPELLAPVGDFASLQAAIKAGADSVYFGIQWLNMRAASARNFKIDELKDVRKILQESNIKGYITLNTLIYDHELEKTKKILQEIKKVGTDGVIATDFATIQLCVELGVEVHISTQLSVANYEAVKFFSQFSPRIVLARECTLAQTKSIKEKIKKDNLNFEGRPIELEAFVHGALCVAHSGRCFMSQHHNRLSANRGQCLQECRKKYKIIDIEDPRREFVVGEDYVMSPKDLCALPLLPQLLDAGIDVLKIEGRAKGPEYVFEVTSAYRKALDAIEKGTFTKTLVNELLSGLEKVFNRGFTDNFFLGVPTNDSWTKFYGSSATEKKMKLGPVTNYYPKAGVVAIKIEENNTLKIGDEVCFIGPTTGVAKCVVEELRLDDKVVQSVKQGAVVSFKVGEKVRESDTCYVIEKRDIAKEEAELQKTYERIGVHKPFKTTKQKGM